MSSNPNTDKKTDGTTKGNPNRGNPHGGAGGQRQMTQQDPKGGKSGAQQGDNDATREGNLGKRRG